LSLLPYGGSVEYESFDCEIAGDSPELFKIVKCIELHNLHKLNSGYYQIGKTNKEGAVGIRIGRQSADCGVSSTIYRKGAKAARYKPWIVKAARACGVLKKDQADRELFRFEVRPKHRWIKRLKNELERITFRDLRDKRVLAGIMKQYCDQSFTWKDVREKKSNITYCPTVEFFDWDKIEAAEITKEPRTLRKGSKIVTSKQAIRVLVEDSRVGDYLVRELTSKLKDRLRLSLLSTGQIRVLSDTLEHIGYPIPANQLSAVLAPMVSECAGTLAKGGPLLFAESIAKEYGTERYLADQLLRLSKLPAVELQPNQV